MILGAVFLIGVLVATCCQNEDTQTNSLSLERIIRQQSQQIAWYESELERIRKENEQQTDMLNSLYNKDPKTRQQIESLYSNE